MRTDALHLASIVLASLALAACNQAHDAKWYMAHGEAMQSKVRECQADPQRASTDRECAAATEAFVTWARASGQAPADAAPTPQP
ncbi:MAG: EexN family lipoprotein [Rhodanobacteraceae bacterium]